MRNIPYWQNFELFPCVGQYFISRPMSKTFRVAMREFILCQNVRQRIKGSFIIYGLGRREITEITQFSRLCNKHVHWFYTHYLIVYLKSTSDPDFWKECTIMWHLRCVHAKTIPQFVMVLQMVHMKEIRLYNNEYLKGNIKEVMHNCSEKKHCVRSGQVILFDSSWT